MKPDAIPLAMSLIAAISLSACGLSQAELNPTATLMETSSPPTETTNPLPDIAGSLVWTRQFGTFLTDEIGDVASDQLGNVYVSCLCALGTPHPSDDPLTPPGGRFIGRTPTLIKLDGEGNRVWERRFEIGSFSPQRPVVATDTAGNVLMASRAINMASSAINRQDSYSFLIKYDAEGAEVWKTTITGSRNIDVTTDADGSVYVAVDQGVNAPFLRKYSSHGGLLWTHTLDSDVNGLTWKLVIGPDGHVNVVGSLSEGPLPGNESLGGWDVFIQNFTPTGEVAWAQQFGSLQNDFMMDAAVDSQGAIFIVYYNDQRILEKFDSSGSHLSRTLLDGSGTERARLVTDQQDKIYLLLNHNWPHSPPNAEVRILDRMGDEVWMRAFPSSWSAVPELIAADQSGAVYLGGETSGALPGQTDAGNGDVFLLKLRP